MKLPDFLQRLLSDTDQRRRQVLVLTGVLWLAAILGLGALLLATLDYLLLMEDGWRHLLGTLLWTTMAAGMILLVILPWWRRESHVRTARRIEAATPQLLHERLSAAVALAEDGHGRQGASAWMVERTVALAAQEVQQVTASQVVPARHLRPRFLAVGGLWLVLFLGLVSADGRAWFGRALFPWADIMRPSEISIALNPSSEVSVLRGSDLRLEAQTNRSVSDIHAQVHWADGRRQRLPLHRVDQVDDQDEQGPARYQLILSGVMEDARLRVYAGDGRSTQLSLHCVDGPRIRDDRVVVTPPEYSGRSPRQQGLGSLHLLEGSTVSIDLHLDGEHLPGLQLRRGDARLPLKQDTNGRWRLDNWQPAPGEEKYELLHHDSNGHSHRLAGPWAINVASDDLPQVRVHSLGPDGAFMPHETALLRLEAEDDVALSQVILTITHNGITRQRRLSVAAPHRGPWRQDYSLDLIHFDVKPGDEMRLSATATDIGGQQQRSNELAITIESQSWVHDQRRAKLLRQLLARASVAQQRLKDGFAQLHPLRGTLSEGETRGTQRADLRRAEQRLVQAVQGIHEVLQEWAGPRIDDDLGQAEASAATRLDAWVEAHGKDIQRQARRLVGEQTSSLEALIDSENSVVQSLAQHVHNMRLVTVGYESRPQAQQWQQRRQELERGEQVLRAHLGWRSDAMHPGLHRQVFANRHLRGAPISSDSEFIRWRDDRFDGSNEFSMRWQGQVRINHPGEWTIHTRVDDGIRIIIDGQDIYGDEAWKHQPPTDYKASVEWDSGWQDISIEFFQDGGGAYLDVFLESPDGTRHDLNDLDLRHHRGVGPSSSWAMARVSTDSVQRAWQQQRSAMAERHRLARHIAKWAEELEDKELATLEHTLTAHAVLIEHMASDDFDGTVLQQSMRATASAHTAAEDAWQHIHGLLRDLRRQDRPSLVRDHSRSLQLARDLEHTASERRRERNELRQQQLDRESERLQAALERSIARDREELQRQLADPHLGLAQRQQMREARRKLHDLLEAHKDFAQAYSKAQEEGVDRPDRRSEARRLRSAAEDWSEQIAATQALSALPQLAAVRAALEEASDRELPRVVEPAVEALRHQQRHAEADQLHEQRTQGDRAGLIESLDDMLSPEYAARRSDLRELQRHLEQQADDLSKRRPHDPEIIPRLADAAAPGAAGR